MTVYTYALQYIGVVSSLNAIFYMWRMRLLFRPIVVPVRRYLFRITIFSLSVIGAIACFAGQRYGALPVIVCYVGEYLMGQRVVSKKNELSWRITLEIALVCICMIPTSYIIITNQAVFGIPTFVWPLPSLYRPIRSIWSAILWNLKVTPADEDYANIRSLNAEQILYHIMTATFLLGLSVLIGNP